jgi:hypothetical protein
MPHLSCGMYRRYWQWILAPPMRCWRELHVCSTTADLLGSCFLLRIFSHCNTILVACVSLTWKYSLKDIRCSDDVMMAAALFGCLFAPPSYACLYIHVLHIHVQTYRHESKISGLNLFESRLRVKLHAGSSLAMHSTSWEASTVLPLARMQL